VLETPGVFVTGTDTGVGKTAAAAAIGLAARSRGRGAVPLKAAQTGWDGAITGDAEFVQAALGTEEPPDAVCPYRLRAPLAPAVAASLEGLRLDPRRVRERYEDLRERYDLVVVEGAGGLLVPFSEGVDMAGLVSLLDLPLVVVARPGLGTLNHTLLTLEAAHRRGLTVLGVILAAMPEEPGLDALTNPGALARHSPVPLLGVLPHDPGLDVESGRLGGIARWGPEAIDPLLGGTFSPARFRREMERSLQSWTRPTPLTS
jgi:dethiobiotin synthetase